MPNLFLIPEEIKNAFHPLGYLFMAYRNQERGIAGYRFCPQIFTLNFGTARLIAVTESREGLMARDIKIGKFYFHSSNLIVHVSGVDVTEFDPYESGRVYVSGQKLDMEKKEVRFGDEISASYLYGEPLTEAQKKKIVAEFAKAGKKGIAKGFFREEVT